jgi:hypothetical protein
METADTGAEVTVVGCYRVYFEAVQEQLLYFGTSLRDAAQALVVLMASDQNEHLGRGFLM